MTADLARLINVIDDKIAAMDAELGPRPSWNTDDFKTRDAWGHAERAALQRLIQQLQAEEGAIFSLAGAHDHSIRLAGFRSSSTSGWRGALRNWQIAAQRRLERGQG